VLHCPFKADVYQVGWHLCETVQVRLSQLTVSISALEYLANQSLPQNIKSAPALFALTVEMTYLTPSKRPSFSDALARLEEIQRSLSDEILREEVPHGRFSDWPAHFTPEKYVASPPREKRNHELDLTGLPLAVASIPVQPFSKLKSAK
jgi:hypothetical protein